METTKLMKLLNEAEGSFYRRNGDRVRTIQVINEKGNQIILELKTEKITEKVAYTVNDGKIESEKVLSSDSR